MVFELTDNVHRDNHGKVQHLEHFQEPFVAVSPADDQAEVDEDSGAYRAATAQILAENYLREVAPIYGIHASTLPGAGGHDALAAESSAAPPGHSTLELVEEKEVMGTTLVSYQQKYDGLPVWEAGVSITIQPDPMRITASQSSVKEDISLPEESLEAAPYSPGDITPGTLKSLLGVRTSEVPTLNATPQVLIYEYDPDQRFDPETRHTPTERLEEAPPKLPLPPVPSTLAPQHFYRVIEVLFALPVPGHDSLNWRAFIESTTGAVLYLRALTACATGLVFQQDPITAGAPVAPPTGPAAALNSFRSAVALE
ncbi:hypothetical protein GL263_23820, partial [Streptomyces durbertensis]